MAFDIPVIIFSGSKKVRRQRNDDAGVSDSFSLFVNTLGASFS